MKKPPQSLEQKAYEHLLRRLQGGELPAGAVISEASVAKRLGLSRMPVRGAIRQLESQGLVRKVPHDGTVVRRPTLRELRESYHLRRMLEGHAARVAARRLTKPDLAVMEKHVETLRDGCLRVREAGAEGVSDEMLRRVVGADFAFHAIILECAVSPQTKQFIRNLRLIPALDRRTWVNEPRLLGEFARVYRDHARILRALQRRNPRAAARAMRAHIGINLKRMRHDLEAMQRYARTPGSRFARGTSMAEMTMEPPEANRPEE